MAGFLGMDQELQKYTEPAINWQDTGGDNLKRKTMIKMTGMLCCIGLLTGCAKTPESALVKQKGKAAMDNYKEADDSGNEQATEDGTDISGAKTSALQTRLNAPETYQNETTDETGKLKICTDATVEIPEADKVPTVAVSQHPFDQSMIDQVTDGFFKGAKIYDYPGYVQWTKADWQKKLEELKGYQAQGNLDPYSYGTDEDGNYVYDLNQSIETAEQNLASAPDEAQKKEVTPQFGLEYDYGNGDTGVNTDLFWGLAQMEDGSYYSYHLNRYSSMPMEIEIVKIPDIRQIKGRNWYWQDWADCGPAPLSTEQDPSQVPSEDAVKQAAEITAEAAQQMATDALTSIGITGMEVNAWDYSLQYYEESDNMADDAVGYSPKRQINTGYIFHYTRKLNGIPVTYTMESGGGLESMDSDMESWCYEEADVIVSKDGVEKIDLRNLYDIGEVKTENVELLSFSEIMGLYEKMMVIQNADLMNYELSRTYQIDRIVFGYGRIYEPASDATSGLLVPTWNFFGSFVASNDTDGVTSTYENHTKYQSYLTLNAVDGSVIDLGLGY